MPPATSPNPIPPPGPTVSRRRTSVLPLVIILLLAAIAATCAILAWDYHRRAREAEARLPLPAGKNLRDRLAKATRLSENERKYLEALADRFGYRRLKTWSLHDVLMLTARLNEQHNEIAPAAFDPARTPWLRPMPPTLRSRTLERAHPIPLDFARGEVELPPSATLYQYTLTNASSAPAPMPILFQTVRWDSADALLETSGLRAIPDETDRAIAIWRFIAEHRSHGQPVTEGSEEHDLIKFLSCHGYGFCDDSAQAVVALAQSCGFKARIRGLNGHVVPELFATGRWRMFDADFAVYFHLADDPRGVLGVDELQNRAAFAHPVALGAAGPWDGEYAAPFISVEDNHDWPVDARREHAIAHLLQPGETVSFSNFNWGRYFLGAYPHKPPRFYNGSFDCPLTASRLKPSDGATLREEGDGLVIVNPTARPANCSAEFQFPFPVVGGRVVGVPEEITAEFVEGERHVLLRGGPDPSLDGAVAQLDESPTYSFTLRFQLPAGQTVRFAHFPRVIVDFQFAEFALLKLQPGHNTFRVHGATEGVRGEVRWR